MGKSRVTARRKFFYNTPLDELELLGLIMGREKSCSPKRMENEVLGRGRTARHEQHLVGTGVVARNMGYWDSGRVSPEWNCEACIGEQLARDEAC